jgi:hypothetical protein
MDTHEDGLYVLQVCHTHSGYQGLANTFSDTGLSLQYHMFYTALLSTILSKLVKGSTRQADFAQRSFTRTHLEQ